MAATILSKVEGSRFGGFGGCILIVGTCPVRRECLRAGNEEQRASQEAVRCLQ